MYVFEYNVERNMSLVSFPSQKTVLWYRLKKPLKNHKSNNKNGVQILT